MLLGWCEVHPTCLLCLSDTNIDAFYLGREGEEALLITCSPVRGWVVHHFVATLIPLPTYLKCEAKELSDKQHEQAKKVNGNYPPSVHVLTTSRTWLLHIWRVIDCVPP